MCSEERLERFEHLLKLSSSLPKQLPKSERLCLFYLWLCHIFGELWMKSEESLYRFNQIWTPWAFFISNSIPKSPLFVTSLSYLHLCLEFLVSGDVFQRVSLDRPMCRGPQDGSFARLVQSSMQMTSPLVPFSLPPFDVSGFDVSGTTVAAAPVAPDDSVKIGKRDLG